MYVPEHFCEERVEVLHALMRRYSFATVISGGGGLVGSQLPVLLDGGRGAKGTLRSHMARANPQWKTFSDRAEVMVMFQGPHAYISPTWYASRLKVPTWNYATVHAYGTAKLVDGRALHSILEETVRTYESGLPSPWSLAKLPNELVTKLESAIVGFEIEITRLEGKWKLNQNQSKEDRLGAMNGLLQRGEAEGIEVAKLMEEVDGPR